jgi:hypothetical protein
VLPVDIDNAGRVLAYERSKRHTGTVVWRPEAGLVISDFPPDQQPAAMNERGWITGTAVVGDKLPSERAAIAGSRGRQRLLGTLPVSQDHRAYSRGMAINNLNQVCGYGSDAVRHIAHAFFWSEATGMIDMVPAGVSLKHASCHALNDAGEAVGVQSFGAFYWTAATGMLDLYGLVDDADPLKARYNSFYAIAINQSGQVVGIADRDDGTEGASILVLTPQR